MRGCWKSRFLSRGKMEKRKMNKAAYFGVKINGVKSTLKATPEAQYSSLRIYAKQMVQKNS